MSSIESLPQKLGSSVPWTEKGGVLWLDPCPVRIRDLCQEMNAVKARFVTITAYQLAGGDGIRLEYHWDLDGYLLGFTYKLEGNPIESIYDICEAVDWIEREIHEEYAIDFTGRAYEPLLLRAGDTAGVNLRETAAPKTAPPQEVKQ